MLVKDNPWTLLWYDLATDDSATYEMSGVYTKSSDSNGTTISNTSTGNIPAYMYFKNGATFNYPIVMEFDFVDATMSNPIGIDLYKSGQHRWNFGTNELKLNDGHHVKIIYDGETIKSYVDDSITPIGSVNQSALSDFKLGFYIRNNNNSFTFKNLIIYSTP